MSLNTDEFVKLAEEVGVTIKASRDVVTAFKNLESATLEEDYEERMFALAFFVEHLKKALEELDKP